MEKIKKNWPTILLLIAIVGCVFILNISTLKSPDDYSYAYTIAGQDLKINSLAEFFESGKNIYMGWTGRVIPHLLVGIFMTTNVIPLKIINSFLFAILIIFSSKFISRKSSFLTTVLALGFFVYGKMFGEKFTWICGSLNYLWTSVGLILYLYNMYGYFIENQPLKKCQKIVLLLSGFIVGFSHEVMSFVGGSFLGILFLLNIVKIWKKSRTDAIFLTGSFLLFGIGSLLTIFAHGNLVRSTLDVNESGSYLACLGNYKDIKIQLFITISSIIGVIVLKKKDVVKNEILYFILPCVIATIPFSIMGYFPPRCFVPYECLIIAVASNNIYIICKHFENTKYYKKVFIGICIFSTIFVFARILPSTYSAFRYIFPYKLKVTKQLEEANKNGEKDVIVSKFLFTDKIYREYFINIDNFFLETSTDSPPNIFSSLYYGFDCVRAISDIDYFIEIETDLTDNIDYGILNKDTLELISIVSATDKICFTIPKDKLGIYVVDCRDKELRSHIKSVRIRAVGEEIQNPDLELLINQEK